MRLVDEGKFLNEWESQVRIPFWYVARINVEVTPPNFPGKVQRIVNQVVTDLMPNPNPQILQVTTNMTGSVLYFADHADAIMFYLTLTELQKV